MWRAALDAPPWPRALAFSISLAEMFARSHGHTAPPATRSSWPGGCATCCPLLPLLRHAAPRRAKEPGEDGGWLPHAAVQRGQRRRGAAGAPGSGRRCSGTCSGVCWPASRVSSRPCARADVPACGGSAPPTRLVWVATAATCVLVSTGRPGSWPAPCFRCSAWPAAPAARCSLPCSGPRLGLGSRWDPAEFGGPAPEPG